MLGMPPGKIAAERVGDLAWLARRGGSRRRQLAARGTDRHSRGDQCQTDP